MAKTSELKSYHDQLCSLVKSGSENFIMNSDRAHNAVVMGIIFRNANSVKMYCGEFSVFRKGFSERVQQETEIDEIQFDPITFLNSGLFLFLERGGQLQVIVEDETVEKDLLGEPIYKTLNLYKKQVRFYHNGLYKDDSNSYHFTIGDNGMYRRESDKERHTAICCFNNKEGVSLLSERFEQLLLQSKPIIF